MLPFWRGRPAEASEPPVASTVPTVENWSTQDSQITVTQRDGFMANLEMRAKLDLPPDQVYELLVDPDNHQIFKNIKRCTYRKVLKDHNNRQTVEVHHEATWRILLFSGTLKTAIYVDQDKNTKTIKFRLKEAGFMKRFEGTWEIQPFKQETLNSLYAPGQRSDSPKRSSWWNTAALPSFQQGWPWQQQPTSSLVTLSQAVLPSMIPPPPLDKLVTGISGRQLRGMMEDVRAEIDRVHQGRPVLPSMKEYVNAKRLAKAGPKGLTAPSSAAREDALEVQKPKQRRHGLPGAGSITLALTMWLLYQHRRGGGKGR